MKQLSLQSISFNAVVLASLSSQYISFDASALTLSGFEENFAENVSVAIINLSSDRKQYFTEIIANFPMIIFAKTFARFINGKH